MSTSRLPSHTPSGRASAIVRADHHAAPVTLTKAEKKQLDDALRAGADFADDIQSRTASFGRYLLETIFDNDAAAALDPATKNPVWTELVRRAGGPTLAISRRMLSVAVRIAALDKRIPDQTWRALDVGRKEILLPLADDKKLRAAASHVSKFNLTQAKTREYVGELLAESGEKKSPRLTPATFAHRIRKVRETFQGAEVLRRVQKLGASLDPQDRAEMADEIEQLRSLLGDLTKALRRG